MNFFNTLLSVLSRTCVLFTVITVGFYIIADASVGTNLAIDFTKLLCILLFSLIAAVTNLIFKVKKIPMFLRILIHYIVIGFFIVLAFMKFGSGTSSFSTALVILGALALIYGIVSAVAAVIVAKIRQNEADKENYVPQFAELTANQGNKKNRS